EEGCRRLGTVAVRSSSAAAASAEASFAGQFRTELDVRGAAAVAEAVRRCRAATAAGYADLLGVSSAPAHIPVLVQQFVEPRQSGVVFTRDPRDPSVLVVESHAGRGEALVSGQVRPRREVLDRDTGARRSVTGGNGEALEEDALRAVVDLARKAEV